MPIEYKIVDAGKSIPYNDINNQKGSLRENPVGWKQIMKWLKRFAVVILSLPVILVIIGVMYEIFGMCINHIATKDQTNTLQMNLKSEISDIEIISVYSETGNTSGTGNHVDCLSSIIFSTEMQETEIEDCMSQYYVFDEWNCYVKKTDDGDYIIYINTSAPFADNMEGH